MDVAVLPQPTSNGNGNTLSEWGKPPSSFQTAPGPSETSTHPHKRALHCPNHHLEEMRAKSKGSMQQTMYLRSSLEVTDSIGTERTGRAVLVNLQQPS